MPSAGVAGQLHYDTINGFATTGSQQIVSAVSPDLPDIKIVNVDVVTLGVTLVNFGLVNAEVHEKAFLSPGTGVHRPTTQVHGVMGTSMYGALRDSKQ